MKPEEKEELQDFPKVMSGVLLFMLQGLIILWLIAVPAVILPITFHTLRGDLPLWTPFLTIWLWILCGIAAYTMGKDNYPNSGGDGD